MLTIDKDLEEIIPEFLELTRKDINCILNALPSEDYETIRVAGHTMKGSGAGYGFDLITEIGAKIEQYAKNRSGEHIRKLTEELIAYLDNITIVFE